MDYLHGNVAKLIIKWFYFKIIKLMLLGRFGFCNRGFVEKRVSSDGSGVNFGLEDPEFEPRWFHK